LHHNQGLVWKSQSRYRVLVAGRRFGKTVLALNELFQNAIVNDESLNWYIAPTYKQAKMIAWRMLIKMIPPEIITKKNESELYIRFPNGSTIELKGADNEDSLRGVGLSFSVLDEFASMKANVWSEIVRPMLTDMKGRALFIGTPKGKNSMFEMYVKGQKGIDGFESWKFGTVDNPFIDPDEVEQARKELPERYFRQEYEASFEDYTGIVWPEFDERTHVIDPIPLEDHWERLGVIDPAVTGTTGVLWGAISDDGTIYIYDEFREANKRVSDVVDSMKAIDQVERWLIDPAAKNSMAMKFGDLYSIYDEYRDSGVYAGFAEKDIDAGINRVGEYFKTGKLKIFSTCKWLLWELERYHYVEDRDSGLGLVKPKPYKKDDHLCDCLRYLIMSRFPKPARPRGKVVYKTQDQIAHEKAQAAARKKVREAKEMTSEFIGSDW